MKKQKIELGDKVKCLVTGFTGIATTKFEFLNGCIQFDVIPKVGKDNKVPEGVSIDENSLEVIKKQVIKRKKKQEEDYDEEDEEPDGGPNHASVGMRGY